MQIYSTFITIVIKLNMDIRTRGEASSEDEIAKQELTKLNDSLIFNIIKKIEVKIAM